MAACQEVMKEAFERLLHYADDHSSALSAARRYVRRQEGWRSLVEPEGQFRPGRERTLRWILLDPGGDPVRIEISMDV